MFNYKKHVVWIVRFFLAIFLCSIAVWIFSLYFVFTEKPLFIPAAYWIQNGIEVKEDRAQQRLQEEKAIFIISGSNSLFGINTPTIERITGYSVYNFGIARGAIPLCLYIYLVEKYVQKGDIVIAPLEYAYYTIKNNLDSSVYTSLSTWGMKYSYILPKKWQQELLTRNIRTYWERLPNIFKKIPIEDITTVLQRVKNNKQLTCTVVKHQQKGSNLNSYGEFLEDKEPTKEIFNSSYFDKNPVSDYFREEIVSFRDRLAAKGVFLYITFPVTEKQSLFDVDRLETQEKLQYYRDQIKQCGINFFGTDEFYNFNHKYMFDTSYHLNATGSILRSLLLAEDINTYVLGKKPSYDTSSSEECKTFYKQQEEEALRIINILREE